MSHSWLQMWDESCNSCWCWLSWTCSPLLLLTLSFSFPPLSSLPFSQVLRTSPLAFVKQQLGTCYGCEVCVLSLNGSTKRGLWLLHHSSVKRPIQHRQKSTLSKATVVFFLSFSRLTVRSRIRFVLVCLLWVSWHSSALAQHTKFPPTLSTFF